MRRNFRTGHHDTVVFENVVLQLFHFDLLPEISGCLTQLSHSGEKGRFTLEAAKVLLQQGDLFHCATKRVNP